MTPLLTDAAEQVVTFLIGPQRYALPLGQVVEVVKIPALLQLAGAPPALRGLLNLHGQHLPVLDGRVLLGLAPSHDLAIEVIIAGHGAPLVGLVVDVTSAVEAGRRVVGLSAAQLEAAPFLEAVIELADGAGLLLNLDALAAATQSAAVAP